MNRNKRKGRTEGRERRRTGRSVDSRMEAVRGRTARQEDKKKEERGKKGVVQAGGRT